MYFYSSYVGLAMFGEKKTHKNTKQNLTLKSKVLL